MEPLERSLKCIWPCGKRLLTRDRLAKWSVRHGLSCSLCTNNDEMPDHLFFKCHYTHYYLGQNSLMARYSKIIPGMEGWRDVAYCSCERQLSARCSLPKLCGLFTFDDASKCATVDIFEESNQHSSLQIIHNIMSLLGVAQEELKDCFRWKVEALKNSRDWLLKQFTAGALYFLVCILDEPCLITIIRLMFLRLEFLM